MKFVINDWPNNCRCDGMQILPIGTPATAWAVVGAAPDNRVLTTCPCCNAIFTSPEAAKQAADAYLPLKPEDSDWVNDDGTPIFDSIAALVRRLAAIQKPKVD